MTLLPACIRSLIFLPMLLLPLSSAVAQETSPEARRSQTGRWEIGIIHVPEEDHASLIPDNYWPIDRNELQRKLSARKALEAEREFEPAVLEEAVYIASLSRDALSSDLSRWKFRGYSGSTMLDVGTVSFALRDARGLSDDQIQLSSDLRFNTTGSLEFPSQSDDFTRWFGFQMAAQDSESKKGYELRLPAASLGRMLISTRPDLLLSSNDVVIEKIDDVSAWLPQDWPASLPVSGRTPAGNPSWWLVHLSGVSGFSLEVDYLPENDAMTWQQAVRKAELSYRIGEETITASALFEVSAAGIGHPLRIQLSPALRLRSLQVDGQPSDWRTYSSETAPGIVLQVLDIPQSQPTVVVEVETVAKIAELERAFNHTSADLQDLSSLGNGSRLMTPREIQLPKLEILRGFTMEGITRVAGDVRNEVVALESVSPEKLSIDRVLVDSDEPAMKWEAFWTGSSPELAAKISRNDEQWSTLSFTRLSIQSSSVSALSNIRLAGKNLVSNELRLPISEHWRVDSARIVGETGDPFRVRIDQSQSGSQQLSLSWWVPASEVEIEIQLLGTTVLEAEGSQPDKRALPDANPIVIDGRHKAFYTIEEMGNLRLDFSAALLQSVSTERELPDSWRSQDTTKSRLVFEDGSGGSHLFTFSTVEASLSANSLHVVKRDSENRWWSTTLIRCEPRSGRLDRMSLSWHLEGTPLEGKIDFVKADGSAIPITPVPVEARGSDADREWELVLPFPTSQPFVIRITSDLNSASSNAEGIIVTNTPGLPSAIATETMIFLPNDCIVVDDRASIELLPPGTCCHPTLADTLLNVLDESDLTDYQAARVDGRGSRQIAFRPALAPRWSSWVWQENLVHRINDSGDTVHQVQCEVQAVIDDEFVLSVPADWRLAGLYVDGRPSDEFRWSENRLSLPVGRGQRIEVEAEFFSSSGPLHWMDRVDLQRPQYDIPSLQRQEWVELSPRNLAVESVSQLLSLRLERTPTDSWLHRWHAWHWWRDMHLALLGNNLQSSEYPGWSRSKVTRESSSTAPGYRISIVHRNILISFIYVAAFVIGAMVWYLMRHSARLGLLVVVFAVSLHIFVDESYIIASQLGLFSCAIGIAAWLIERIKQRSEAEPRRNTGGASGLTRAALCISLLCWQTAAAQEPETSESKDLAADQIYGVIVPSDLENNPSGDYVYIPKLLRDKLYASEATGLGADIPKVLSANYSLKFRQSPRDVDPIQECSVELRIMVADTQSEILLPFRSEGLKWISTPQLNGQPRILDGRNFRLDPQGAGIYFRGESIGIANVTLQFKPMAKEIQDRRFALEISIPKIPNAVLRLSPSGMVSNLKVESRGLVQRSFLGDTIANLGPVDRLKVEWTESDRATTPVTAEQTTQTWVSIRDKQIVAAAMLNIERP